MLLYKDLRDWLAQVDKMGELKEVHGADWNLEIGAVTDMVAKNSRNNWATLFDKIKDYPVGYRVLTGQLNSPRRLALTVGLDPKFGDREFVVAWRERLKTLKPIPPEEVTQGPIMENVQTGDEVNLLKFPVPQWHELDGGRYIGTGSATISRDPDDGSINLGTYRVMVHDEKRCAHYAAQGKHGRMHRDKYFARNEPCPVALVVGEDPLLYLASILAIPHTQDGFRDEYDWIGGVRGEPYKVIRGKVTGLPIPAQAEIVLEGFSYPDSDLYMGEGPFGEWPGYYASRQRSEPVMKVEAVYHRNNPIISGAVPSVMPSDFTHPYELIRSAQLWNELEAAGLTDISGVTCYQHRFITVVSIRQRYGGHAKRAAMLAMHCNAGAFFGRYVIVVDDDIDIYDFNQVVWAISTRVDPVKDIEIVKNCWESLLDPIIPAGERKKAFQSRAIIDATKPYDWFTEFPPSISYKPELKAHVHQKWQGQGLFDI
jgi:UbiD family decarboxylase